MTEQRKVPIRMCVSCRASSEKKKLLRIVRGADGQVRIDPTGKMPGRGAYLCDSGKCLALALKTNKLNRALRCNVPESLVAELERFVVEDNAGKQSSGNEEKQ